jgi:hypothetical protein
VTYDTGSATPKTSPPPSEGAGGRLKQQEKPILWTIYIHHYNPLQSAFFYFLKLKIPAMLKDEVFTEDARYTESDDETERNKSMPSLDFFKTICPMRC